jgi:hypothetical protein
MAVNPASNIPSPDPSLLTTDQLRRELSSLREIMEARLNAIDKATSLFEANLTRVPTDTDKQIFHLKELHDEKFEGIEKQFTERDVRSKAAETAAQVAVNAALQAQKEAAAAQNESNSAAITKSDAGTVKQIDGILALLASSNSALNDKIAVINGRLDRGEGGVNAHSTSQATIIAISAVILTLVIGGFTVLSGPHPPAPTVANPTVSVDTKRVDDLIAQSLAQSQALNSRLDALSARMTNSGKQP